jgi:hypothetical protein
MMDISVYDDSTGEVRYWTTLSQREFLGTKGAFVAGHHNGAFYFIDLTDPDNPTPTERPASPVTLTDLTLQHLPVGGDLFIDGTRYEITDTTVELAFPLPGTFQLRVERFPYLDWTGSVTV